MIQRMRAGFYRLSGNARGILFVTGATLALTLLNSCNKALAQRGFSPLQMVFACAGVILLLLAPHVLASRGRAVRTRSPLLHLVRGVFIAFSGFGMAYAASHLVLAECNVYLMSCSLFMLPLGALFLGERAHWMRWLGVLIGFCGVLLILQPRFSGLRLGALAALGAALSEAILGVCLKKLSQPEGACTIIFWSYLSNCVVFGVLSGFRLPALDMTSCGILLFSGLATLCIFWCFILAYRAGEASAVEVGSFSLLLFSPLLGFVLFGEVPSRLFWLGALVMSCGTFMVWFEPIRPAS